MTPEDAEIGSEWQFVLVCHKHILRKQKKNMKNSLHLSVSVMNAL